MFKCALIGAWHVHFDGYAQAFSKHEDCEITCLWDNDAERGARYAEKYECEFVADYDEVLKRDDVDGIIVSSPTNLHTELLIKAANAKKHIFTEKILCFTEAEALKIKDAVEANGIKFCISFPFRPRSDIKFAKKAIDEGLLGDVYYVRVRDVHDGASAGWLPAHFYNEAECGGGAMIDLGAHPMYLINYFMGLPAKISSTFTKATGKAVEDNAVSVLEYANGAIACSETGFVSKRSPVSIEISGTGGTMFVGGVHNEVIYNVNGQWEKPETLPEASKAPIEQWIDAVINNGEIEYGISDAVELTILMEKAYEAHRSGKKVCF